MATDQTANPPADQLSLTFAALADPTRRAILARLAGGEATVNELAQPFDMSMQAVSKHLKVLERAGLISRSRTAQWRPARLVVGPLESANDWIDRYREVARDRFDRLDAEIQRIKQQSQQAQQQEGEPQAEADPRPSVGDRH
jgi:DNA-binding transcriptional ArsR family regulator